MVSINPRAEGYSACRGRWPRGISVQTRERIALAVAEIKWLRLLLSAHSYLGRNLAN